LIKRSKVLNRAGTFVGTERLTGVAEISFAPFVLNRKARRRTDFDEFGEPGVRAAAGAETGFSREPEWEKVMGNCEAP
jgi:hypothetical protein